jgi:hypothetical protein
MGLGAQGAQIAVGMGEEQGQRAPSTSLGTLVRFFGFGKTRRGRARAQVFHAAAAAAAAATHARCEAPATRGRRARRARRPPTRVRPASGTPPEQGGGGNPFDMGKLMESVKKAQQMVQVETARVQQELEK